jgi:hypothetical protein
MLRKHLLLSHCKYAITYLLIFKLMRYSFTSLMALIFEICYIYYAKPEAMQPMEEGRPEERTAQNLNQAGLL